jgi:adenylate cyclase
MDVARRQGTKSLELRSALSLGRLLRRLGRTTEAAAVVAESYGRIMEGFDTPDVQDARAFLHELKTVN